MISVVTSVEATMVDVAINSVNIIVEVEDGHVCREVSIILKRLGEDMVVSLK